VNEGGCAACTIKKVASKTNSFKRVKWMILDMVSRKKVSFRREVGWLGTGRDSTGRKKSQLFRKIPIQPEGRGRLWSSIKVRLSAPALGIYYCSILVADKGKKSSNKSYICQNTEDLEVCPSHSKRAR